MQIAIREATTDDAEAIAHLGVVSWQAAYAGIVPQQYLANLSVEARAAGWRKSIESGRLRVLLAYVDNTLAGWRAFGASRDSDKNVQWAEVEAFYVLPDFWGKGIGKTLNESAQTLLRRAGYSNVLLWVLADNHRARMFYQRIGFVCDASSKVIEIGGAPLIEVRYLCALTA